MPSIVDWNLVLYWALTILTLEMSANRTPTESFVDLLIVGAGPAGLMLALWASKFDMKIRIVDDKSARVRTGHADGMHSRTIEIFQSFGIARDFISRAYHINEICKWVGAVVCNRYVTTT